MKLDLETKQIAQYEFKHRGKLVSFYRLNKWVQETNYLAICIPDNLNCFLEKYELHLLEVLELVEITAEEVDYLNSKVS